MTKPFAADLRVAGGVQIGGGVAYPNAGAGVDLPNGSYYLVDDGTWWKKVYGDATAWVQLRTVAAANGDTVPLIPGMPVASAGDMIVRACATSEALANVIGIVASVADPTLVTQYIPIDLAFLTQAAWNLVTGGISGLTPGAYYYLSNTPGMLTTTAPSLSGTYLVKVGKAVTSTGMLVAPQPAILL
jgi:hypothetical protein